MRLLLLVMLIVPTVAFAKIENKCKQNLLYCKIVKINPKIEHTFALELSEKIYKKAKDYGINPNIVIAILAQESGFNKVTTFKTRKEYSEFCTIENCYKINIETKEAFDLSFAQINIGTAKNYRFALERLHKNDVDYVLSCFFIILKDKMKMCSHLKNESFSCYHSTKKEYRLLYLELVKRFL